MLALNFQSNLRESYEGDYMVRRPTSRGMAAAAQGSNRFDQSSKRDGQGESHERYVFLFNGGSDVVIYSY